MKLGRSTRTVVCVEGYQTLSETQQTSVSSKKQKTKNKAFKSMERKKES